MIFSFKLKVVYKQGEVVVVEPFKFINQGLQNSATH